MAQIRDLLVAGKSRFLGSSIFSGLITAEGGLKIPGAKENTSAPTYLLSLTSPTSEVTYTNINEIEVGTAYKLFTSAAGTGSNPVYFSDGVPVASTADIGTAIRPVYMTKGVLTPMGASGTAIGTNKQLIYFEADTGFKASTASVGSTSQPVYLSSGTVTGVNCVSTTYGGTGSTTQTAERLVYTDSQGKLVSAGNHFAGPNNVYINFTGASLFDSILFVGGRTQVHGELAITDPTDEALDKEVKFQYNKSDRCLDIVFI